MRLRAGGRAPHVDATAIVAPTAVLSGDVSVGPKCVIGHGAILVAEGQPVRVGGQVIVRDHAVIRSTHRHPVTVGSFVLIGPHATLFGCTIEDEVFLATGSTVFHLATVRRRAEIRVNAVVHLRTVVPEAATVPIGWIAVGNPASILPPGEHDRIWAIQEPLDFPGTVYGLARDSEGGVDMRELTRRLFQATASQKAEE